MRRLKIAKLISDRHTEDSNFLYSTQPFIAWIINHYYYQKHYVYLAPFFPYRLNNPKSSNPYLIYSDLYMPWKDRDIFDKNIAQYRINLRKGVLQKNINTNLRQELLELCDKISIDFFYPIVYRINIFEMNDRLERKGSAINGSEEYLIKDLRDFEFEILFADELKNNLKLKELYDLRMDYEDKENVLKILKSNYDKGNSN